MYLLKEQLLEKKHPDKVEPAEYEAGKGDDKADDQAEETALLTESGPSYKNFGDPVHTGNEEQNDLHQTALFVKPSHDNTSVNKLCW